MTQWLGQGLTETHQSLVGFRLPTTGSTCSSTIAKCSSGSQLSLCPPSMLSWSPFVKRPEFALFYQRTEILLRGQAPDSSVAFDLIRMPCANVATKN